MVLSCLFFFFQGATQNLFFKSTEANESKVSITGTSTLHGWTVNAGEIELPEKLTLEIKEGANIDSFSFKVKVESLDGGRGTTMNKKINTALKAASHPMVIYTQTQSAIVQNVQADNSFSLTSIGMLEIAGLTKEVEIQVNGQQSEGGQLRFKGSKDFKFSDFEIEPPSAMFGQIVCGEDITVHFELVYSR